MTTQQAAPWGRVRKNIIGQRFGHLVVVGYAPLPNGKRGCWCWCDGPCGGSTTTVYRGHLTSGHTISCGCARRARAQEMGQANVTHGLARAGKRHPLYGVWTAMHTRCENPADPHYPRYGGRGVYVCERWSGRDGFPNFLADILSLLGEKPGRGWSIDRIDNDGNYEPSNVRWATPAGQGRNRGNSAASLATRGRASMRRWW